MKHESSRRRLRRQRRGEKIRRIVFSAAGLVLLLAQTGAGWAMTRQQPAGGTSEMSEAAAGSSPEMAVHVLAPEKEDGSGQAGRTLIPADKTPQGTVPGWQQDASGRWYAYDAYTCYQSGWEEIDGQTYHFDADGYCDTGWTAIGGQGYYFDENGVYQPDADSSRLLALTFDDGPGQYTGRLLDLLENTGARATFFMLGTRVEKYGQDTIPRMKALGCLIGNHSYDHTNLKTAGLETARAQFEQTDSLIAQYNDGNGAQVIRFPYGEYTRELSASTGRPCIFWDVDSMDWDSKNADAIRQVVRENIEGGDIILMHDIYETTVEACETLIPDLQAQGWQFVTVEELAAANGYDLEPGVTYFGFTSYEKERGTVTDENRGT